MLLILIRSASLTFLWDICFCGEIRKICTWILLSRALAKRAFHVMLLIYKWQALVCLHKKLADHKVCVFFFFFFGGGGGGGGQGGGGGGLRIKG